MSKLVYRGTEQDQKSAAKTNVEAAKADLTYRGQHNDGMAPIASVGGDKGQTYRGQAVSK